MLDAVDQRILASILARKGEKRSPSEHAKGADLGLSSWHRRIARLKADGVLGESYVIDPYSVGLRTIVFALVTLRSNMRTLNLSNDQPLPAAEALDQDEPPSEFENLLKGFDEVVEVYAIAGAFDYLLKVVCADLRKYDQFIRRRLSALPFVERVTSHIVLEAPRTGFHVAEDSSDAQRSHRAGSPQRRAR